MISKDDKRVNGILEPLFQGKEYYGMDLGLILELLGEHGHPLLFWRDPPPLQKRIWVLEGGSLSECSFELV